MKAEVSVSGSAGLDSGTGRGNRVRPNWSFIWPPYTPKHFIKAPYSSDKKWGKEQELELEQEVELIMEENKKNREECQDE